ncbi:MAG: elongation factor G, partial [Planctomycetales bacterium]
MNLTNIRNLGVSAHVDSGKTTLSERILFYAGRIHAMHEVRGGDGGAVMDHMELERERGITITSAATSLQWQDATINLIDTPGHVDFTVEVERSLRVLDGAIMVLCAVSGVQAQSHTIDRQMKRYHVPRIAFINKMDRQGAEPFRAVEQLRKKLGCDAVMMQLPIGRETNFEGVIDLIAQEAIYYDGTNGEKVRKEPIPEELAEQAAELRDQLLDRLSMFSDELMETLLNEETPSEELIHRVVREATIHQEFTPVLFGTAVKNKGVQTLLDAVVRYLPSPLESEIKAWTHDEPAEELKLDPDPNKPFVGMAFKIAEDSYGTLTYMRVYQGTIKKGESYYSQRTGKKERFSRIVQMHAAKREDVDSASAGDIVAVLGVESASGDTYAATQKYCALERIHVPEPVMKIAVRPSQRDGSEKLSKALHRFRREDPTFHVSRDPESGETIICGMGELHLEVYVERMRREYGLEVSVSEPKVNYRESPTCEAKFNHKLKKQTGGSGQFAHIVGRLVLLSEDDEDQSVFEEKVVQGRIPRQYIPAVEKGFLTTLAKGPVAGFPIVGLRMILEDGSFHDVDSSEYAFKNCTREMMQATFKQTAPILLEPIMKVEIECLASCQGPIVGDLNRRRGLIISTEMTDLSCRIEGEIPLAETFGYVSDLRSLASGSEPSFT